MQRIPRNCGPALHLSPSLHSMLWALSARPFRFQKCQWCSGEGRNHEVEGKRSPAKGQSKCLISHWANHSLLAGWRELGRSQDPYLPNIPVPNQNWIWQGSDSETHGAWSTLNLAPGCHTNCTKEPPRDHSQHSDVRKLCSKVHTMCPGTDQTGSAESCHGGWVSSRCCSFPRKQIRMNKKRTTTSWLITGSNSKCRGAYRTPKAFVVQFPETWLLIWTPVRVFRSSAEHLGFWW